MTSFSPRLLLTILVGFVLLVGCAPAATPQPSARLPMQPGETWLLQLGGLETPLGNRLTLRLRGAFKEVGDKGPARWTANLEATGEQAVALFYPAAAADKDELRVNITTGSTVVAGNRKTQILSCQLRRKEQTWVGTAELYDFPNPQNTRAGFCSLVKR